MSNLDFSIVTIFTASLLGSLHCIGMCGGFVVYNTANSSNNIIANLLYNLGRLSSYCLLGFLGGILGGAINKSFFFIGVSHFASIFIGFLLIAYGIKYFIKNDFPFKADVSNNFYLFGFIRKLYKNLFHNDYNIGTSNRSFLLGFFSALLPCGWLYSFVGISASFGDPLIGTFIMLVFWLGTLPALISTAIVSRFTVKSAIKFLPRITAIFIILAGFLSITNHYKLDVHSKKIILNENKKSNFLDFLCIN